MDGQAYIILLFVGCIFLFFFLFVVLPRMVGYGVGKGIGVIANNSAKRSADDLMKIAITLHKGEFEPEREFNYGMGTIAFDTKRNLFYVGSAHQNIGGEIFPMSALIKHSVGWIDPNGRGPQYYIDVTVKDIKNPVWRIWVGQQEQLATEIAGVIDVLWHR